jgi:hypothetical protein
VKRHMSPSVTLAVATALLLSGCGEAQPVATTQTVGAGRSEVRVLVEHAALAGLRADIDRFVTTRPLLISSGGGTADAIAATVKQGYRISVVVLPSGPALDRVRDELLAPPTRLGTLGAQTYWLCTVDRYGAPLARFLAGRTSQRVLRSQGFRVSPSP